MTDIETIELARRERTEMQIIEQARRERLVHGLVRIGSWCVTRSIGDFNTETTLTMLEKKAKELRAKVDAAGHRAINKAKGIE